MENASSSTKQQISTRKRRTRPRTKDSYSKSLVHLDHSDSCCCDDVTLSTAAETSYSSSISSLSTSGMFDADWSPSLSDAENDDSTTSRDRSLLSLSENNDDEDHDNDLDEDNDDLLHYRDENPLDLLMGTMNLEILMRSKKVKDDSPLLKNEVSKLFGTALAVSTSTDYTIGNYTPNDDSTIRLPTPSELSNELCKVIAAGCGCFSDWDSLKALSTLTQWAESQDRDFFQHFLNSGGVGDVLGLLQKSLVLQNLEFRGTEEERNEEIEFMIECLHKSASVLCNVCFKGGGRGTKNENLAARIATEVVNYNGIQALLLASEACTSVLSTKESTKDEPVIDNASNPMQKLAALKALEGIWNAIMNIYCSAEEHIDRKVSLSVMDSGILAMRRVLSSTRNNTNPVAFEAIANIFNIYFRIVTHPRDRHVNPEDFLQRNILVHCITILEHDLKLLEAARSAPSLSPSLSSPSAYTSFGTEDPFYFDEIHAAQEALFEEAILFFQVCHRRRFFPNQQKPRRISSSSSSSSSPSIGKNSRNDDQYKRALAVCAVALHEFPDNSNIRICSMKLLHDPTPRKRSTKKGTKR